MPAFSAIKRPDPIEFTAELEGEVVSITFDRKRVTLRWAHEVQTGVANENVPALASALASVLIDWDVTDDQGNRLKPTEDVLMELPVSTFAALSNRLQEESAPTDAEGNALPLSANVPPSGSLPDSPSSPNGLDTSTSPQPSESLSST